MKKIILLSALILSGCNSNNSNNVVDENPLDNVEKRIYQNVDAAALGLIDDLVIESVSQLDSVTFQASHTFTNPMMEREMRITNKYTFTSDLDSIINKEDVKTEMKSEEEWVDTGF
jgi:PBP1b-binding outer membrane lipoprotein LpoB